MEQRIAKKGDIIVRNRGFGNMWPQKKGSIFECWGESSSGIRAMYNKSQSVPEHEWRFATSEEIEAYNQGARNINDINAFSEDFSVFIHKDEINPYINLCKKHNIKYNPSWEGNNMYYGIYNNGRKCDPKAWGKKFETVEQLSNYLNNKQNEKTRIIKSDRRLETKGTSISSSRIRQIAVKSRPIGNTTSARTQKTRISRAEISKNIISC